MAETDEKILDEDIFDAAEAPKSTAAAASSMAEPGFKELYDAIVSAAAEIDILEYDEKNKEQNYAYASVDAFIRHVRLACLKHGLFFIVNEAKEPRLQEMRRKDGSAIMYWWTELQIHICHVSGAMLGPINKTVMVLATGAQAAGSAQSYALKQVMRHIFLIPTGEADDPDKETPEITAPQAVESDYRRRVERFKSKLKNAKDLDALSSVWDENILLREEIAETSTETIKHLEKVYDTRDQELRDGEPKKKAATKK